MPSGEDFANLALQGYSFDKSKIQERFNVILKDLVNLELEIYERHEKNCSMKIIEEAIKKGLLYEAGSFIEFFEQNYIKLREFFKSIFQSRVERAGGSFERHVSYLLELLGYPFDKKSILNGKVDYLIPSENAFRKNRTACVVISIKRTLRERWRQVIGELASTNAGKIYMLTADKDISYLKVEEMRNHNVNLVIWDEYKKEKFQEYYNVLGFTQFVNVDLPSSRKMWERLL